jgi:hypothetical protein
MHLGPAGEILDGLGRRDGGGGGGTQQGHGNGGLQRLDFHELPS